MTKNEQAHTKDGRPKGERVAEDTPDVYANVVHANVGPFDVTMDFGFQTRKTAIQPPKGDLRGLIASSGYQ